MTQDCNEAAAAQNLTKAKPAAGMQPGRCSNPDASAGPSVIVYSDGASRGNPGPAGAGWVICTQGEEIARGCQYLGHCTNNEAEYMAAALGLKAARGLNPAQLTLRSDSELLVRQIQGRYQVKNTRLLPLYQDVKNVAACYPNFKVEHVLRHLNSAADAQANKAIDEAIRHGGAGRTSPASP